MKIRLPLLVAKAVFDMNQYSFGRKAICPESHCITCRGVRLAEALVLFTITLTKDWRAIVAREWPLDIAAFNSSKNSCM
jgi:hypothetical protein